MPDHTVYNNCKRCNSNHRAYDEGEYFTVNKSFVDKVQGRIQHSDGYDKQNDGLFAYDDPWQVAENAGILVGVFLPYTALTASVKDLGKIYNDYREGNRCEDGKKNSRVVIRVTQFLR